MPCDLWSMELWELTACVRAHNQKQRNAGKEQLAIAWQTAAFAGAAFAGKLRKLDTYIKDDQKQAAPVVDRSEFEKRLAAAKEGRGADGA